MSDAETIEAQRTAIIALTEELRAARAVLREHELSEAQGNTFCPSCDAGGFTFRGHAPGCAWVKAVGPDG